MGRAFVRNIFYAFAPPGFLVNNINIVCNDGSRHFLTFFAGWKSCDSQNFALPLQESITSIKRWIQKLRLETIIR